MGDGSRRVFFFLFFFLMDHKHREETPILRECQEFSREMLAFATAAARARVRGSVTFLLGCDARSIAPSRAFLAIYLGASSNDRGDGNVTFREKMSANASTRQRDETSVTRARIGTTRTVRSPGGFTAAAAFDLRLPPSRGNEKIGGIL